MNFLKNMFLIGGLLAVYNLKAQQIIESFDNISTLPNNGWVFDNRSNMPTATTWAQGDATAFSAQSGAANSYIVNDTGTGVDLVCNWLIMPDIGFIDELSFFTRAQGLANEVSRMFVMYSSTGATNTGDCVSLPPEKTSQGVSAFGDFQVLLSINDTQTANVYPQEWAQYSVNIGGNGRVAFLYYVETGAPNFNSGTVAIDTISKNFVDPSAIQNIPIISYFGLLSLMFLVLIWAYFLNRRHKEKQA